MSKDIRSFFSVISKKSGDSAKAQQKLKKPVVLIDSDDEDVVKDTPEKEKVKKTSQSKRRAIVLSSDSEEEAKSKNKSPAKKKKTSPPQPKKEAKPNLKPINLDALNRPIKQSEVKYVPKEVVSRDEDAKKNDTPKKKSKKRKNPEIGVHGDKDFEKTLDDLDEDTDDTILMDNLDFLDKTIEEATLSKQHNEHKKEESNKSTISPSKEKKTSDREKIKNDEKKQKEEVKDDKHTPRKAEKRPRKSSESTPTPKKKKLEQKDSGIDQDLVTWDKKRQSAGLYVSYLHRPGPKHHGEKDYPKGKPGCLKGITFLRTGVLDSLEGEEFGNLVTEHGGRVVSAVSKKVNYLVVGDEPGPSKLDKARKYNISEISEDEFLDMILVKSGMKPKYTIKCESERSDMGASEDLGIGGSEDLGTGESEDMGIGGSEEGSPKTEKKMSPSDKQNGEKKISPSKYEKKTSPKNSDSRVETQAHGEISHKIKDSDSGQSKNKPNLKKLGEKLKDQYKSNVDKSENKPVDKSENKPVDKSENKPVEKSENKPVDKSEIKPVDKSENKSVDKSENKLVKIKKEPEEKPLVLSTPSDKTKTTMNIKKERVKTESKNNTETEKVSAENMSWTDKYKPTNIKGIIGQQDTNSNMNKLKRWLESWFKNADPERRKKLPKPTLYNQYDGAFFKAALLSGSPGVGKTTTATLVAQELGFDIVEFNASDTRSKKLLNEEISHMMRSKTVAGFVSGKNNMNQKRVLLMDEVDGMAGNEDRGGIAELINFIKTANFPIVCMCNNRDLPKMRTLVNHCYGLKFGKPNVAQVRGAMLSICFKEGLSIKPDALAHLITGTGCDIRQTLNHLSMWSAAEKSITSDTVEKESKKSQKDVVFGAWDVIRKVFNKAENKDMSLEDKSRLFFYDYSFGPLFVQEHYLTVQPEFERTKDDKSLERLIRRHLTAECLSRSDMIESKIRSTNNWSLLSTQAYLSTVLPSYYLSGKLDQVRFPGWFGKNSQRTKSLRMTNELYSHARTSISGDKFSVRLDYAEPLTHRLLEPLIERQAEGIDETLEVMKSYSLLRDDLSNLCELVTNFSAKRVNPFDSVSSSVKAALTRKYNKTVVLSFAPPTASKKKKGKAGEEEGFLGEEDDNSEEEETEDNVDTDTLIKVKNKNPQAGTSKASGSQKEKKSKGKSAKSSDSKGAKGKTKK